jgi:hypothetical protein
MNPRTNFEDGHKETVRAFATLFRRSGDEFQFAVDGHVDDSEEVRSNLIIESNSSSVISVTSINKKQRFENIKKTINEMNLNILEENESEDYHDSIGAYTAYTLEAKAVENEVESEGWNIPHLIVYGSLSPEITNSIKAAFGSEYDYYNIRNHFVLCGKELDSNTKTELADAIKSSGEFFEDQKRSVLSSVRTSSVV